MGNRFGIEVRPDGLRVAVETDGDIEDVAATPAAELGQALARWQQARGRTDFEIDEVLLALSPESGDLTRNEAEAAAASLGAPTVTYVDHASACSRTDAPTSPFGTARGALIRSESHGAAAPVVPVSGAGSSTPHQGPEGSFMADFGDGRSMDDFGEGRTMDDVGTRTMADYGQGRDMAAFGAGAAMGDFGSGEGPGGPPGPEPEKAKGARGKLMAAAAAVVVLVLAGTAVALASRDDDEDTDDVRAAASTTAVEATSTTIAPSEARLEGAWIVDLVVVSTDGHLVNPERPVGTRFTRRWTIAPKCAAGPCDLAITREVGAFDAPELVTQDWSFADGVYTFSSSSSDFCIDDETGAVREDLPTQSDSKFEISVTELDAAGRPSSFRVDIQNRLDALVEQDLCLDGSSREEGVARPA